MKEEKIIIVTMIINFIVAVIKLASGILFSFSTLIADSVQSFIDFITDITSLIANKIGKRRANKRYPFGYGQVYYLANLFTGFLLFLIGIFIVYQFFYFEGEFEPNKTIFLILILVLLLKFVVVRLLKYYGKIYKSELMIEASKESNADFISTCVVLTISIILLFKQYIPEFINIDKLGSLGMAVYVFYTSYRMIFSNLLGLITKSEENEEIKEDVEEELSKFIEIEFEKIKIIKMSSYYNIFLQVKANDDLTIKEYLNIEKKIKSRLRAKNRMIRFIDIQPV